MFGGGITFRPASRDGHRAAHRSTRAPHCPAAIAKAKTKSLRRRSSAFNPMKAGENLEQLPAGSKQVPTKKEKSRRCQN